MVKKTNKKILLSILISIILVSFAVLVIALSIQNAEINVVGPGTGTNWSGLAPFNVSFNNATLNFSGAKVVLNATFWTNISGGAAGNWYIIGNASQCFINSPLGSGSSCSGTINATALSNGTLLSDGYYYINATLHNQSTGDVSQGTGHANLTLILIDTTQPKTANFTFLTSGNNHSTKSSSGNLTLNITADDNLANISSVIFVIINSTGQVNGTLSAVKEGTTTRWSTTINTSHYPNGKINITLLVNDTAGNYNVSANNSGAAPLKDLIFDNALPSVSFSCTPTTLTSGDTVTCSCSGSATSGVNSTSFTASPSTSSTGTYTQTCEVISKSGVTNTASASYTIELSGSGSPGGGSATTTTVPSITGSVAVSETKLSSGYRAKFSNNAQVESSFTTSSGSKEKHSVKVTSITTSKVMITVSSDPVNLELSLGETKKVDLDSDKIYDLSLTFNEVVTGKADISVKKISEAAPTGQEGPVSAGETPGATNNTTGGETTSKTNNVYLWVILVVVVIVIICVIVYYVTKKKKK